VQCALGASCSVKTSTVPHTVHTNAFSRLQKVLGAMSSADARASHVASVRERFAALADERGTGVGEGVSSGGGAGPQQGPLPRSNGAVSAPGAALSSSRAGGVALIFSTTAAEEAPAVVGATALSEGSASLQAAAAALQSRRIGAAHLPPKTSATLASSSAGPASARGAGGSTASSGSALAASSSSSVTAGRIRRASDAVSQHSESSAGAGEEFDDVGASFRGEWGPPHVCSPDTAASDPHVQVGTARY
jgi:hypothetical protein